jgi:hypothetical protein
MDIRRAFTNNRLMKALTGLSKEEFNVLVPTFGKVIYEDKAGRKRERAVGGGQKGALVDEREKLFFILLYLKIYPTCDFGGFMFDVDRSRICKWTKQLMPLLEKALGRSVQLPKRAVSSMEEFLKLVPEAKDLFIDGTERETQRPKSGKLKKKRYSGKKKRHTRKNTIVCDENRKIVLVTPTKEGRLHDLSQLKKTGFLDYIPKEIGLWVDKGYTGIQKILRNDNQVMIPHKKPRGKLLTPGQKQENSVISGIRMTVEHAIGGIKRFASMSNTYRNKQGQDDMMIYLCSGLWNFHLQYKNI